MKELINLAIEIPCKFYRVKLDKIQSNTRKREVVQSRQIASWLLKKYTSKSLATIGMHVGNKNHATVLHSVKTINNLIETDKIIKSQVDTIERCFNIRRKSMLDQKILKISRLMRGNSVYKSFPNVVSYSEMLDQDTEQILNCHG